MNDQVLLRQATVLVVDDEPANIALLERILASAGVEAVHTTRDPSAAVQLFQTTSPDLVLLDLHMPRLDGLQVLEALGDAADDREFVPVILLTADSTPQARDRALAAGVSDFLTKPFDRTEVLLRARNLLHTRELHSRLRSHNDELQREVDDRREVERQEAAERSLKEQRLRSVLSSGGPRMVFQPIADLSSGTLIGHEALARFDSEPSQPPNVWFTEAANVGLGAELELAAARGALRRLAELAPSTALSINVSPDVAASSALADLLAGTDGSRVILEITEHEPIPDYEALHSALAPVRAAGVRLAVDDAGAGFAGLQHILRLRPDIIKLDISLTRHIDRDPIKRALASSLVTFSAEMRSVIIAEGIESRDELDTLARLGVPWGQGFFLGEPGELAIGPGRALARTSTRP